MRQDELKRHLFNDFFQFLFHRRYLQNDFHKIPRPDFAFFQQGSPTVGTLEEAEQLVKKVRERDPNHDIYIGHVGKWMPWDPEAYKTGRVEYLEEKLNELHHAKIKNEELAKMEFDKRVKEAKFNAIKENVELAKKNNNVLTQTIDKDGNLTGVMDTMNLDEREPATAEMKDKNREEMLKKYGGSENKDPL